VHRLNTRRIPLDRPAHDRPIHRGAVYWLTHLLCAASTHAWTHHRRWDEHVRRVTSIWISARRAPAHIDLDHQRHILPVPVLSVLKGNHSFTCHAHEPSQDHSVSLRSACRLSSPRFVFRNRSRLCTTWKTETP